MGSARHLKIATAAFALVVAGAPIAALAGQRERSNTAAENSKRGGDQRENNRGGQGFRGFGARDAKGADFVPAPVPSARGPEMSAPSPNAAAPAAPPSPPFAATVAPGLSHNAPTTPPRVGWSHSNHNKNKHGGSRPSPASTPEPSMMLLLATGMAGLYRLRHRD